MSLLRFFDDLIAPRGVKCLCCDVNSAGQLLCADCARGLLAVRVPSDEAGTAAVRSSLRYDGVAKDLVLKLKLEALADAAEPLADVMAETVKQMDLPDDTILTWVTMPTLRRLERGIDHGRKLCEALGRRTGFPVRQLLTRRGRVHTQRGLSGEERLNNLQGSLVCREKLNRPVLLVDDVMTTGATVSACTRALLEAGAPRVYALTATKTARLNK